MRYLLVIIAFTLAASICPAQDRVTSGVKAISNNPAKRIPPVPSGDEHFTSFTLESGVRVTLQITDRDKTLGTHLICYLLPNGSTTEYAAGRTSSTLLDWQYDIQHIAAQTRRVREFMTTQSVITAYFEADTLSWPAWRKAVPDSSSTIVRMMDEVRQRVGGPDTTVDFVAHSGGGSFTWGYLNGVDALPNWLQHIVYIDANYSYEDDDRHGDKLLAWLRQSPLHRLVVFAYDDRRIMLNGVPIVSDTGGTWRATDRMARRLERDLTFTSGTLNDLQTSVALDGRVLLARHPNPQQKILHTVLVERNGFVYGVLAGRIPLTADDLPFSEKEAYRKHVLP